MIELNVDDFITDTTSVVIICHPTGVKYTAQAGGVGCTHPYAEGFLLIFQNFDIDDCSYGCSCINEMPKSRLLLAEKINEVLNEKTEFKRRELEFDFTRINELQEGWWPIKIKTNFGYHENEPFEGIGWLHNGNCD